MLGFGKGKVVRPSCRTSKLSYLPIVFCLLTILPNSANAADTSGNQGQDAQGTVADEFGPVEFAARPPESELLPRNANEEGASVLVLSYSVEHKADISNWALQGTTTQRHRGRYLVRDTNGVANLQKHTFFGDESDVIVANVQGQTISPDGSVHPIDPDKDIRKLDIERAQQKDDILRTVNFPRVEPGAILDLAWTAQQKQLPSMEVVDLEGAYPIRDLSVKVRGRLIGQGKAFMLGSGEYYWVPFFASRIPDNTKVRMSTAFDLELEASGLPSYQGEPLSPPALRTSAWLAVVPQSFHIGNWKENFHLFDNAASLPDVAAGKREWFETTIGANNALSSFDELGLQTLPLMHSAAQLKDFQATFRAVDRGYKTFLTRKKTAESPERLAVIAPPELSVDERVDRILDYVAKTIELRQAKTSAQTLMTLKKRGYGSGFAVLRYTYYLLEQAGLPVSMVWIANRTDALIVPALNNKDLYGGAFFIEVDNGASKRYLMPYREHYDRYSLPSDYLGAVMFRRAGKRKPWVADRVDLNTAVNTGVSLRMHSPLVADEEVELKASFEAMGERAGFFQGAYGRRAELAALDTDSSTNSQSKRGKKKALAERASLESVVEREARVLRAVLGRWVDTTLDDELTLTTPIADPESSPFEQKLVWNQSFRWEPKIEDLGDSVLVPPFPMVGTFRNQLVDDKRTQPIWLSGGTWNVQMNWVVGPEFAAPEANQSRRVQLAGPGGLSFVLEQSWDDSARIFKTDIHLTKPFLLPASDYAAVQRFFVDMQRAVEQPVLLQRL